MSTKDNWLQELEGMEPHTLSEDEQEMYRTMATLSSDGAIRLSNEDELIAELEMTDLIISLTANGPQVN